MGQKQSLRKPVSVRVSIHIYDLQAGTAMATLARGVGCGLYHTGVQVTLDDDAPVEYAFSGDVGIYAMRPKAVPGNGAPGETRFREAVDFGLAELPSRNEWHRLLAELKTAWPGTRYDLLKCNCNHFSEAMLQQLNPSWVFPKHLNRAAGIGGSVTGAISSLFRK